MYGNLIKSQIQKKGSLSLHLSTVDLSACGSNQNYPLIDYLQGLKKSPNGLDIKSPLRYLKCLFGVACWKRWAFSFLQDGRVKPVTVAEWAKPARAAVRWDYGTTVGEGTATQGRGEQLSHQWLPDGTQAQVLFLHIQMQFGWLVLHKGLKLGFFIMRLTGVLCGKLDNINFNMLTPALNAL